MSWRFGYVHKGLVKKIEVLIPKFMTSQNRTANDYNTHTAQYFKK